jgi:hypothetical protein
LGAGAGLLTQAEWTGLLESAGLEEIAARIFPVDVRGEFAGLVRRYGCGGTLGIFAAMFRLYLTRPDYRAFVRETTRDSGPIPDNVTEYSGYGMYAGRKPA